MVCKTLFNLRCWEWGLDSQTFVWYNACGMQRATDPSSQPARDVDSLYIPCALHLKLSPLMLINRHKSISEIRKKWWIYDDFEKYPAKRVSVGLARFSSYSSLDEDDIMANKRIESLCVWQFCSVAESMSISELGHGDLPMRGVKYNSPCLMIKYKPNR